MACKVRIANSMEQWESNGAAVTTLPLVTAYFAVIMGGTVHGTD